jgi:uncharacterized repeat protein (TIGR03803 family)
MKTLNWREAAVVLIICALGAIRVSAQSGVSFTTLVNFDYSSNGANPEAPLIQATDGNLYGTAGDGGANGWGTIFKITPGGTLTTIYNFCSLAGCTDGALPLSSLVEGADGNFYGTTNEGGNYDQGTVFKITPGGKLATLYSFNDCSVSGCLGGYYPYAGLLLATDGNFYGTTGYGGEYGGGIFFEVTPAGAVMPIASLSGGERPVAPLIEGSDGNFYGTMEYGGDCCGSVFKISAAGAQTTLHTFCSQKDCPDGAYPNAGLLQAADGKLYGMTADAGFNSAGTIYEISTTGVLTVLYRFHVAGGVNPLGALIQATDGNLYGTTSEGGTSHLGTLFSFTLSGTYTALHSFSVADGGTPYAPLIQDTNGNFYGTTEGEGSNNAGTVYELSVGLGPFVETQPTSGTVGSSVKILGTNLTGATGVTFNGTAATFKVLSSSLISTTVPAGATTGPVQLTKPHGTVTSNVNFQVLP